MTDVQGDGLAAMPRLNPTMSRVMNHDDFLGVTRIFHGYGDGSFAIETIQDNLEDLVEANKFHQNNDEYNRKSEFRHVAALPMVVWQQLKREGKLDDQAFMKKWLNDREQRPFRTNEEVL